MELAEYLRDTGHNPEQVQDFYPTPSTLSTVMYYTGLDPRTMEPVYVPKNPHEKAMQRALMQYRDPKNYVLVKEALVKAGRTDLIGFTPKCLIRPYPPKGEKPEQRRAGTAESVKKPLQNAKKAVQNTKKTEKNAKNPAKNSKNFAPDNQQSAPKRAQSTSKGHLRRGRAD